MRSQWDNHCIPNDFDLDRVDCWEASVRAELDGRAFSI
jgi:hypothetical protein